MFLKALNERRIIHEDTLTLMHSWHTLGFPLHYGYGTMYFTLPSDMTAFMKAPKVPPLWGLSGSTGSFLYYSEDLNLYMAGSINRVGANSTPFTFRLMIQVMQAIYTKIDVQ